MSKSQQTWTHYQLTFAQTLIDSGIQKPMAKTNAKTNGVQPIGSSMTPVIPYLTDCRQSL